VPRYLVSWIVRANDGCDCRRNPRRLAGLAIRADEGHGTGGR
jgi:hypothetical protein